MRIFLKKKPAIAMVSLIMFGASVLSPQVANATSESISSATTKISMEARGEKLANRFFELLKQQNARGLSAFLSKSFQIQRADNTFAHKAEYISSEPKVVDYSLSGFDVTSAKNVIVVRYKAQTTETPNGNPLTSEKKPRMSVFVKNPRTGKWQLTGHSNFDVYVGTGETPTND